MTVLAQSGLTAEEHFNSHPHEEDDWSKWKGESRKDISTHILTKRMTSFSAEWIESNSISTHILTKRMTCVSEFSCWEHNKFQLTSSRRGWQCWTKKIYTWWIFQLTSSRRGWLDGSLFVFTDIAFQLTSSRRGWPCLVVRQVYGTIFQLTSSRRGWQFYTEGSLSK